MVKVTNADGSMVSYSNPQHVVYIQMFTEPIQKKVPGSDPVYVEMAYGEVVAPGGVFIVWKQNEMDEICKVFGIED